MFEKDAEIYADKNKIDVVVPSYGNISNYYELKKGFKDGAEFGYNKCKEELNQNGLALQSDMDKTIEQNIALKRELEKANEWHYVKDGDLPKTHGWYFVCYNNDTFDCVIVTKDLRFLNFYTSKDMTEAVYAWKEIVLPKEIKENESRN